MAKRTTKGQEADVQALLAPLARRHSTATVLFHHAMAERLGLGPSDHKCLDLLLQHDGLTGSRLAAITGLTTGAITGVVNRLEQAGYVQRRPDPTDRRRQLLQPVPKRVADVRALFTEHGPDPGDLVAGMDADQVSAVVTFLTRATEHLEQRSAVLRAQALRSHTAHGS
ncbi:MAG TPA: MarR family transcriptional regulator [Nocardioidaceae bacterium]|nr:MarR family transcriptional regulator [Nocardioidaceae bacterium]